MTRLIVVDATPYGPEPSGSLRRAVELMHRLPALLPDDVFEMHWAQDGAGVPVDLTADNLVHARVEVSCRGGFRRWRARRRQLAQRHRHAPFTHLLTDYGPVIRPDRVANIVTVHDLRFLHGYGGWMRRLYGRLGYGRMLRRASRVVCVSPSVAAEVRARLGIRGAAGPFVVGNAPAAAFQPGGNGSARAGALVVGRDERRKARGAAQAAAREAGLALTVVDDARGDEALAATYRGAAWLLAPSLEEGYDLPVVEALACGTPVIASDIGAHRDLADAGAEGLCLVPRPVARADGALVWPEAAARLRAPPPRTVSPPPGADWDAAARELAARIQGSAPERR